ncbi:hypothetical protein AB0B20_06465 [Micromonospora sp. NPDC049151]|uniref:hypothetical protein n=1 Tax=Micromonospora sp. NPDC049151 TaxID=3155648 RepID=UPI0033CF1D61
MWRHMTLPEQDLWYAVMAGVRAFDAHDQRAFDAATRRLLHHPRAWRHAVLEHTAVLLIDEIGLPAQHVTRLVRHLLTNMPAWQVSVDLGLLTRLAAANPGSAESGGPTGTTHRLLLVACLTHLADTAAAAFVDTALTLTRPSPPADVPTLVLPRARTSR